MGGYETEQVTASRGQVTTGRPVLREILETIFLTLVIYASLRLIISNFRIAGSSMEPNLHDGQYIVIARWSYWLQAPQRGDVIVFKAPNVQQRDLVKRIVGLPGEQIEIRDGQVFVDGKRIQEPYAHLGAFTGGPWSLSEGQVFVLGDNRGRSQDSRSWGPLQIDQIIGKGLVSYWPPRLWGRVPHYAYERE